MPAIARGWKLLVRGWLVASVVTSGLALLLSAEAWGEQASEPLSPAAGKLDVGGLHSCAVVAVGGVRCWGYGGNGQLGYGSTASIGDDESPSAAGPVNLGPARTVKAIAAGGFHTCAVLDDHSVRCWGFGADGQLGYGGMGAVGATPATTPDKVGPVNLGPGHTAKSISAGEWHTCAVLDDDTVRCWGFGGDGRLGYGNTANVREPSLVGPVDLGPGRTAKAITAGKDHTCALLDDGKVRCWGFGGSSQRLSDGRLGYGNTQNVGDDEPPGSVGPVKLGVGRTAVAIAAGRDHTCAVLDDGSVRCWGSGLFGQLGYGDQLNIGDSETPDAAGPVNLGSGRRARAITAGDYFTCAILDDGSVRCWGQGLTGQLGYGNEANVGDNEAPAAVGPVSLGLGRTAVAISAGRAHTCARLDDGSVRCWGKGISGQLGYCNQSSIGDDEQPASAGPVDLGAGGARCRGRAAPTYPSPAGIPTQPSVADSEAARRRDLRRCLARVTTHLRRERRSARRGSQRHRTRARRHLRRHARRGRRRCLRRYGRTPGRVRGTLARALGRTKIELSFQAPGTDGSNPPPARRYLIKQSRHPIRTRRDFARADTLCKGSCRFAVAKVGGRITLTISHLRPRTTYYYVVAARDNVSARRGPYSRPAKGRTR